MSRKKHSNFLGPVDTAFLHVETPTTPMNIGAITIFEGQIDFDEFLILLEARLEHAPVYKKRLVQAPLNIGEMQWAYDPEFDINNHVFRMQIDEPGTTEQLRQLTGQLISSTLDRDKPLWEVGFIEGLSDNRTALFFKVHHCMVDGLAAVELFSMLLDLSPDYEPVDIEDKRDYNPPPLPDTTKQITDAVRNEIPYKWKVVKKISGNAFSLGEVFFDKEKRRKALYGVANLINDNLTPIKSLVINGKNSGDQEIAWIEFSLAEVRKIKSGREASVNDVMLYVLSTAIERYLEDRMDETDQDFLRVLIPVSMRLEQEREQFGNRISVLPIDVPFGINNPLERLQAIAEYTTIMKESSLSNAMDMILSLPSLALPAAQPLIWSIAPKAFSFIAHTWCTNVSGPQIPVYLQGHKMLHSYGYFPLNPSMGLACVVMSYNQHIGMNLVVDQGIVPDVDRIRDHMRDAYVELRKAAKVPEIEPIFMTKVEAVNDEEAETAEKITDTNPDAGTASVSVSPSSTEEAMTATLDTPEASVQTKDAQPEAEELRIFTEEWAIAYKEAINGNPAYKKVSTGWEAGSLAFVMQASARDGYPKAVAVLLDLHKGVCRDAHTLDPKDAYKDASFVIEGDHRNWMYLLSGQGKPLPMLMRGKLKLKKGSVSKLMPYSKSAQELLNSAQMIKK